MVALALTALIVGGCQSAVSPNPSGPGPSGGSFGFDPSGPSGRPVGSPAAAPFDIADSRYRPEAGRAGGSVTIGDITEANAFQPFFATQPTDRNVAAAVWAGLVEIAPDGRYLPDLAASVPTASNGGLRVPGANDDAMTVTWRLRPDLEWSDGEPLTCDDVRYTWQWVIDPDNVGVDTSGFEDIEDVACLSATDMVWHFRKVYPAYLTLLATPLPRHFLSKITMEDQVTGAVFGPDQIAKVPVSGPFRITSVVPGGELRIERNDHYTNPIGGRQAHLAGLIWRWYADPKALVAAFAKGDVDVATGLGAGDLPADKAIAARAERAPSLETETLILNWSRPPEIASGDRPTPVCSKNVLVTGRGPGCPTADPAVRAAIANAVDKAAIVRDALSGTATVVDSPIPDDAWFATPEAAVPADPGKARSLLDAAGWTPGPDGVRARNGLRAVIEICVLNDPTSAKITDLIAAQLRPVGISVVPRPATAEELEAEAADEAEPPACSLAGGRFDAALVVVPSPTEPLGYFFANHSSQTSPAGPNVGGVRDDTIDAALNTVATTLDPGEVRSAMASFQTAYRTTAAAVPLYRPTRADLVGAKIGNVVPNTLVESPTWNAADWYRKR